MNSNRFLRIEQLQEVVIDGVRARINEPRYQYRALTAGQL